MSSKKDFGTTSRGLLGLGATPTEHEATVKKPRTTQKNKETKIRTTIELSEENLQFIEDIKTIEGGSIRTVLNDLLDDLRIRKRAALDKALEIHNQGRDAWKKL